jgi:hypothetical protein
MASCHSFFFYFTVSEHTHNIYKYNRPLLISSLPLSRGPPLGCRAKIRTRACLTASRRATICATHHPVFVPRRTLFVPRRTLFVPRRTLICAMLHPHLCVTPHPLLFLFLFQFIHYLSIYSYFTARVMKFGNKCEFREYPDMRHGWTVRGDLR